MAGKALQGVRVLELGSLIGAPFCGTLMAEFGADVIKVEDPEVGDMSRHLGQAVDGTGLMFASLARNKRCVTLDLRRPEGQAVLARLARTCDVVIENFRPGTLAAWHLDYATLSKDHPRLVMAHVSGFGQTGPYRDRLAFDRIATAFSGQDFITGFPENPPTRPGGALADYITGMFCTIGVLVALHHRDQVSGRGQEIDLALYEGILRLAGSIEAYDLLGTVPQRLGNANPAIAPAETFRSRDGHWLSINGGTDNVWKRLLALMGREDPRDAPGRGQCHRGRMDGGHRARAAARRPGARVGAGGEGQQHRRRGRRPACAGARQRRACGARIGARVPHQRRRAQAVGDAGLDRVRRAGTRRAHRRGAARAARDVGRGDRCAAARTDRLSGPTDTASPSPRTPSAPRTRRSPRRAAAGG
jgi:crotonobetainyl-CoA:carnitine CoA-transferase CaiB-like acyl-CoA transferase